MTQYQKPSFSVAQSGRSPEDCSHGWLARGRCVFCGMDEGQRGSQALDDLLELEAMELASYDLLHEQALRRRSPSPPEPSE